MHWEKEYTFILNEMDLPAVSIVIPTLNSVKTIGDCLDSILIQDYPMEKLEIIIADGGSADSTVDVVKSKLSTVNYHLLSNNLRTGEAGKAVGVKQSKNEIVAFIDSDNILPQPDWLKRMIEPFQDLEIIASEPLYYTYRPTDGYITRYCAILGMNDPLCLFLGNYDRYSILTGRWTGISYKKEDKGGYIKIKFPDRRKLPTIGANGFCIRRNILLKEGLGDYLFDIDILNGLLENSQNKVAKVKIGIVHIFSGTIRGFIKKQSRRVKDYYYYKSLGFRKYAWGSLRKIKILQFIFSNIAFYPLLVQSMKGYFKKRDLAWFYHPIACWLTCYIYSIGTLRNFIGIHPSSRNEWRQG